MGKLGTEINVFNENVEYLKKAREELAQLENMKKVVEALKADDKRLQKAIVTEEKSISDEIDQTLKKRKEEIADAYDKELENNREQTKRFQAKRNRIKNKRMNERVGQETAGAREENRLLETEMKTLFKQNHVPSFCSSKLYYALFMPRGIGEICKFIGTILFSLFCVPMIICLIGKQTFLSKVKEPMLYYVIIFAVCIILFFLLYILIMNHTKVKYRDTLLEGRKIKEKIKANNKKIKAITNSIAKDKDESKYELHDFDEKLQSLQEEANNIVAAKQQALKEFENETQNIIIDEIQKRRMSALNALKEKYKENEKQCSLGETAIQEQALRINQQYETYLGKDFMKAECLSDLITIMEEEEDVHTVSEAIAVYKS